VVDHSATGKRFATGDRPETEEAGAHSGRGVRSPRSWAYGVAVAVTLAIVAFNIIRPITVLPRIAPSPGFSLLDAGGLPVTSEDLRGRLTLYSFTYLDCPDACPQSLDDIAALRRTVGDLLSPETPLSFVTISLDPQHDTPARLQTVTREVVNRSAGPDWRLLTGDPLRTRYTVGGGFGVYYAPAGDSTSQKSGRITFDPRYVLVDGLGIMRAEYRTGAPAPELVVRDVNLLVKEAANSDGIARLGYEAAHLFLCYPR